MNPVIAKVIKDWEESEGPFSFEIRLHPFSNPSQISSNAPFIDTIFIIDVSGFFLDEKHLKPIKLHRERVISIDRFNTDPIYVDNLRRDLSLFSKSTYSEFNNYLSSLTPPIFTSDPKFMLD